MQGRLFPLTSIGFSRYKFEPFIISWARLAICLTLGTSRYSFITLPFVLVYLMSPNSVPIAHTLTLRFTHRRQPLLRGTPTIFQHIES
jgi:hypothetical protein